MAHRGNFKKRPICAARGLRTSPRLGCRGRKSAPSSLTKEGAGTIILGGADDLSGTIAVTEGTLIVAADLQAGALTIADGATVILSSTGAALAGNAFGEDVDAPFTESAPVAVPEPASAALVLSGALALLGVRRRCH